VSNLNHGILQKLTFREKCLASL